MSLLLLVLLNVSFIENFIFLSYALVNLLYQGSRYFLFFIFGLQLYECMYKINCVTDLYWLGKERCRSLFRHRKEKNVIKLLQIAVVGVAFTGRTAALACRLRNISYRMSSLH